MPGPTPQGVDDHLRGRQAPPRCRSRARGVANCQMLMLTSMHPVCARAADAGLPNAVTSRLKKITTTDEGAVALAIELQVQDDDELNQIRDLIRVQQGEVRISIAGTQSELPV